MKNLKIMRAIAILFVFTLLITNKSTPIEVNAASTIPYQESGMYQEIPTSKVLVDDMYYGVAIIAYSDATYNHVILTSKDGNQWQFFANLSEKSTVKPEAYAIRHLKNYFIVSLDNKNGQVRYLSKDGLNWDNVNLAYQDITYDSGVYWALDNKGAVFHSEDMIEWEKFTQLTSSSQAELLAINLAVNKERVVVSHYAPKWGANNYLNGLEIFQRNTQQWILSQGYKATVGTTIDIVNTGEGFILAYQNDYSFNSPILFYKSSDGINWVLENNEVALKRLLNPLVEVDSNVSKLITILKNQIIQDTLAGKYIPIQVYLDHKLIEFDQDALLVQGRVYVPVRKIFEVLGGSVELNKETQVLSGQIEDMKISMKLGEKTAQVNGETVILDAPAQVINNRTLVPARFIADCVGKKINWDQDNYILNLND